MAKDNGKQRDEEQEPKPWAFRFKWDGRSHEITMESLTYGERAELEEYMGLAWPLVLASAWAASAKLMIYLAYIAVRRSRGDEVSLSDLEALTDDDIVVAGQEDGEARPTEDEGATSGRSSSSSGTASSRSSSKSGGPKS